MKIFAPVKDANGVWASVRFVNGVGETDDPSLIEWFRNHGYKVPLEDTPKTEDVLTQIVEEVIQSSEPDFDAMSPLELREWMRSNGYGNKIKNTRNKEKLLEILRG
jgi:hypothetical protein